MIKAGQNVLASDFTLSLTAGETLATNDFAYISTADGKAYKCDADDLTKMDVAGVVQTGVSSAAAAILIPPFGIIDTLSGLTVGARYYLSGTAGAITATPPTNVKSVGVAMSATVLLFDAYPTKRIVKFTSSGTWTKRPGLKWIDVELLGGGGAGDTATGNPDPKGGGGTGGYAKRMLLPSDLGATETVTIGAAGSGASITDGGTTSFGSLLSATGGAHGSGSQGGASGVGSGGDINGYGEDGENADPSASLLYSGRGGQILPWGKGGARVTSFGGNNASGYSGGGSGGRATSATDRPGGDGTPGIVVVTEYY